MKADVTHSRRRKLRVGDHVSFMLGYLKVNGVIVEDRGLIGAGGRRLWGIEFQVDPTFGGMIELPEVDIIVDE